MARTLACVLIGIVAGLALGENSRVTLAQAPPPADPAPFHLHRVWPDRTVSDLPPYLRN